MKIARSMNVFVGLLAAMATIQDLATGRYGWALLCAIGSLVNLHYGIKWSDG